MTWKEPPNTQAFPSAVGAGEAQIAEAAPRGEGVAHRHQDVAQHDGVAVASVKSRLV